VWPAGHCAWNFGPADNEQRRTVFGRRLLLLQLQLLLFLDEQMAASNKLRRATSAHFLASSSYFLASSGHFWPLSCCSSGERQPKTCLPSGPTWKCWGIE